MRSMLFFLSLLSLAGMSMQQPQVLQSSGVQQAQQRATLDPRTTIIAFDLDEVVVNGREKRYKDYIAGEPELAKAMGQVSKQYKTADAGVILSETLRQYPQLQPKIDKFAQLVIYAPQIPGTFDIITDLVKKGYSIVAASNMTPSTYQAMVENKVLPPQFSHDFFFVPLNKLNKKPDGTHFQKPEVEYYQNLVTYINQTYPGKFTHYIFTDDKLANAQGAQKVPGLISIQFKNPQQLRADLRVAGVDI